MNRSVRRLLDTLRNALYELLCTSNMLHSTKCTLRRRFYVEYAALYELYLMNHSVRRLLDILRNALYELLCASNM